MTTAGAKTFTYELTILEQHLDLFQHVNHAVYFQFLEEARWDLATLGGWGVERVKKEQIGPVILEAKIQYRKELKLQDRIRIETVCTQYGKLFGTLNQRILKQSGEVSALAEMRFGLLDLKRRKLISPPEDWLRAIGYRVE